MTDPYAGPADGGERPPAKALAIVLGAVLVAPTLAFVVVLASVTAGAAAGVGLAVAQTAWALYLVTRQGPVARGVGVGMLIVGSILLLLIGSCALMIANFEA